MKEDLVFLEAFSFIFNKIIFEMIFYECIEDSFTFNNKKILK